MSEDFLKNPLSLFDVSGKTAIVTGATGAFGAMAAKVLSGAGANVVLCANNADALQKVAAECGKLGGKTAVVAKRPSSEANCDAIVAGGGQDVRPRRHPRGRVRAEQGLQDRRPEAGRFPRCHGCQRHPILADGARGRRADAQAGPRRQGHPDVVGARAAWPPRWIYGLLRLQVGRRRHHQGARLRVGRYRHHGQRARADGVSLPADPVDVRGHRTVKGRAQGLPDAGAQGPPRRGRPTSPGRCCSSRPRRRTSTPVTSFTPTAATRRGEPCRASPSSGRV